MTSPLTREDKLLLLLGLSLALREMHPMGPPPGMEPVRPLMLQATQNMRAEVLKDMSTDNVTGKLVNLSLRLAEGL